MEYSTSSTGMTVKRAITGATTVAAGCYAMVTYHSTAFSTPDVAGTFVVNKNSLSVTRIFGPGQAIPTSYNTTGAFQNTNGTNPDINHPYTVTMTLLSGVEIGV